MANGSGEKQLTGTRGGNGRECVCVCVHWHHVIGKNRVTVHFDEITSDESVGPTLSLHACLSLLSCE